jgi:hypothetical protein
MDPSTWDGAAITMGNSTKTWRQSYAPTLKNRSVQGVVDVYSNFTSQVNGGGDRRDNPPIKPRIPSSIPNQCPPPTTTTNTTTYLLPAPSSQRINNQMMMPFMCLPQPEIGAVEAILVNGNLTGKKRVRQSGSGPPGLRPGLARNFEWGGEWGGW